MIKLKGAAVLSLMLAVLPYGQGALAASKTKAGADKAAPATTAPPQVAQPAPGEGNPLETALIVVDKMPVTTQDYINYLQTNPNVVSRAVSTEAGKAEALRELVRLYLLRKAMYDEGLLKRGDKPPTPKELADAYEKLAEKHFPVSPKADEKGAYEYYQANSGEYAIPRTVRLNQILFKYPPHPEPQVVNAAKERAESALKRLASGEKFSAVAVELSENPIGKVAGGDIGFVEPGREEWMEKALKDLKVGDRTGLVESPEGIQILEITDTRPALVSPYANVRDQVMLDMQHKAQKKIRDAYVLQLAKKVVIEVPADNIKPLFPHGVFPE